MSAEAIAMNGPLRVFMNHVYEYKKGIRRMILMTMLKRYQPFAIERLTSQGIAFHVQEVSKDKINLYFGREECLKAVRLLIGERAVNELSPEEDFILGTLLGYDVCQECDRYCALKEKEQKEAS